MRKQENTVVIYPDAVGLEIYYVIIADGEPITRPPGIGEPKTPVAKRPQREFRTHQDAVRFAAALVGTGHVSVFQVESVYRAA